MQSTSQTQQIQSICPSQYQIKKEAIKQFQYKLIPISSSSFFCFIHSYSKDIPSKEDQGKQNFVIQKPSQQRIAQSNQLENGNRYRQNASTTHDINPEQFMNAQQLKQYQIGLDKKQIFSQQQPILFQFPSSNNNDNNNNNIQALNYLIMNQHQCKQQMNINKQLKQKGNKNAMNSKMTNQPSDIKRIPANVQQINARNKEEPRDQDKLSYNSQNCMLNKQLQQQQQNQSQMNHLTNSTQQKFKIFEVNDNVNEKNDRPPINETKQIQNKIENLNQIQDQFKIQQQYNQTVSSIISTSSSPYEAFKMSSKNNQIIHNPTEQDKKATFFNQQCQQHFSVPKLDQNNILKDSKQTNIYNYDNSNKQNKIIGIPPNPPKINLQAQSSFKQQNDTKISDSQNSKPQTPHNPQSKQLEQKSSNLQQQQQLKNINSKPPIGVEQKNNFLINHPNLNVNDFKMNHMIFKSNPFSQGEAKMGNNQNSIPSCVTPKDANNKNNTSIQSENNVIDFKISSSYSLQQSFEQTETTHKPTALINKIDIGRPIHKATKSIFNANSPVSIQNNNNNNNLSFHSNQNIIQNNNNNNIIQNNINNNISQINNNNKINQNNYNSYQMANSNEDTNSKLQVTQQTSQHSNQKHSNSIQSVHNQSKQSLNGIQNTQGQFESNQSLQQQNSQKPVHQRFESQINSQIIQHSNQNNDNNISRQQSYSSQQSKNKNDNSQNIHFQKQYNSTYQSNNSSYQQHPQVQQLQQPSDNNKIISDASQKIKEQHQDKLQNDIQKNVIQQVKQYRQGSAEKPQIHLNGISKIAPKNIGDQQGGGPNSHKYNIDIKQVENKTSQQQSAQFKFPQPSHFDRDSFKSKRSSVQSHTGRSDSGSVGNEVMRTQQNNGSNHNFDSLNYEKISQQQDKSNFIDQIKEMSDNFFTKTQQFFQNNLKKINQRLGCSCDLNLKMDGTCSKAYEWLFKKYKKEELDYLKKTYENIRKTQLPGIEECKIQIEKDLKRTFPSLEMFQNEKYIGQLRNLLQSVAMFNPGIGYVQGMNMIAASLLYHAEEYISFWIMHIIFEKLEMWDIYKPCLPGLSKHIQLIDIITLTRLPDLYSHFVIQFLGKMKIFFYIYSCIQQKKCQESITFDMFCSPWIFSLFGVALTPQKLVKDNKIKDNINPFICELLEEGWLMFYKLVIAFLCYHKEILFQQDMGEMLVTLTQDNYKFDSQEHWELLIKHSKNVNIDSVFINSMLDSYDADKKQFNMKHR